MNREIQKELELMEGYQLLANKQKGKRAYQVPAGYFEEKKQQLSQLPESKQYQVPSNYFDTLSDRVMSQIDTLEEQSVTATPPTVQPKEKTRRNMFAPYLSIAAAIALLVGAFFFFQPSASSDNSQFADVDISDVFTEEELAFLNNDAETYVLDALFDDFSSPNEAEEQLLDPLFEDSEDPFDSLFLL